MRDRLLLAVAKQRTDPDKVPGLEAQMPVGAFILDVMSGAVGTDNTTLLNKVDVATDVTVKVTDGGTTLIPFAETDFIFAALAGASALPLKGHGGEFHCSWGQ